MLSVLLKASARFPSVFTCFQSYPQFEKIPVRPFLLCHTQGMRTQQPLWRAHAQLTTPPASPHEAQHTVCILVSSPCGGVGTSTFAALLALAARQFTSSVALVDRDPRNGGLDVLLGIEEEKGLRWSGLEAPLGTLDYQALAVQLPRWKSVAVLSADPWNGVIENPWEKEAVYAALTRAFSVLIIDAGTAHEAPVLVRNAGDEARVSITSVELLPLSILACARMRGVLAHEKFSPPAGFVACSPRGGSAQVNVKDAEEWLALPCLGKLNWEAKISRNMQRGTGLHPSACLQQMACAVLEALLEGVRRRELVEEKAGEQDAAQ